MFICIATKIRICDHNTIYFYNFIVYNRNICHHLLNN